MFEEYAHLQSVMLLPGDPAAWSLTAPPPSDFIDSHYDGYHFAYFNGHFEPMGPDAFAHGCTSAGGVVQGTPWGSKEGVSSGAAPPPPYFVVKPSEETKPVTTRRHYPIGF